MILPLTCLCLAAFPLVLAFDNLRQLRTPGKSQTIARVSVLVPARNEESTIGNAIDAVLANVDVELDLWVLNDSSTDGTAEILAGVTDPRLHVLSGQPLPDGWCGKQYACSQLAVAARAPLLVFVDADVRLAPDALSRMANFMEAHPDLGLASGFPRQVTLSWAEWLLLPLIHFLLVGFLPMRAARLSLSPAYGAGCGQLIVVRSDAYARIGGHATIRASLHDGITLPRAFRRAGIQTGLFDATALASCRMYSSAWGVWNGLLKNATEGMAKPIDLPIWTIVLTAGQILPFLLLPDPLAVAGCLCVMGLRVTLAWRFKHSWKSVLCHPLAVAILIVLQWTALIRSALGLKAQWRGRQYPA